MVNLVGLVLRMREQLLQLSHVFPGLAEVQGPEVLVERVVDEILSEGGATLSMLK